MFILNITDQITDSVTQCVLRDDGKVLGVGAHNIVTWDPRGEFASGGILSYSNSAKNYSLSIEVPPHGPESNSATSFDLRSSSIVASGTSGAPANIQKLQFKDLAIDLTSVTKTASLTKPQIDSLVELYLGSFDRAPDALGLNYWGGRLKDGMSLEAIARNFFSQPETVTKYPVATSNESFVSSVYSNVLERAADVEGLRYWTSELANGHITRDKFLLSFIGSARANQNASLDVATLNNKVAVAEHFALTQGLSNGEWAERVMSGVTSSASSITTANAMTDGYAAAAAAHETSQLVVKIVGVVS